MAGAIDGAVRSRKNRNEYGLTLCQADQARSDFAAIAEDLEFIRADWRECRPGREQSEADVRRP